MAGGLGKWVPRSGPAPAPAGSEGQVEPQRMTPIFSKENPPPRGQGL